MSKVANAVTQCLPKFVSRDSHRVCDYLVAAALLSGGLALWRQNRAAAVISLAGGGSLLALTAATDHIGKDGKALSYATHAKVEQGLALFLATSSEFLGIGKRKAMRRYFNIYSAALTALTNLTEADRTE